MTMLQTGAEPVSEPRGLGGQSADGTALRARFFPCAVCPRRFGLVSAAVLAGIGALFAIQAARMDFGSVRLPGPGFFPLFLGMALAAIGGGIFWQTRQEAPADEAVDLGHSPVAISCALLLALSFGFEPLGAYISLGLFSAAFLILIAKLHPVRAAMASAAGICAVWLFFHKALGVQLPTFHW